MRIGMSLADPAGPEAFTELRDQLRQAADDGFASAWISNIFGLDALTALALAGRLALGIGLSHRLVIEDMYGQSFERPARHMSEYLSILLPLLDGAAADFDGDTMRAKIGLSVSRPSRVPVLLAAMAPAMLRLAGERADGTVLWMTGPATVRDC